MQPWTNSPDLIPFIRFFHRHTPPCIECAPQKSRAKREKKSCRGPFFRNEHALRATENGEGEVPTTFSSELSFVSFIQTHPPETNGHPQKTYAKR